MLRNTLTIIIGLAIAIWIGSLFVWAGAAFIASVACALLRQWELTSLFALACVCWGYSGLFFARLSFAKSDTGQLNSEDAANNSTIERRISAVFGIVSGTGFGLGFGLVLAFSRSLIVSPEYLPLGLMFSTISICTLMCYVMRDLGPEILSALEKTVD